MTVRFAGHDMQAAEPFCAGLVRQNNLVTSGHIGDVGDTPVFRFLFGPLSARQTFSMLVSRQFNRSLTPSTRGERRRRRD
jgi:hypothetical protein